MAVNTLLAQVSAGMQAQSADGNVLGTITGVSTHGTETYLEVTPARSLASWLHLSHNATCTYFPGRAVTAVAGTRVVLSMDADMELGRNLRPHWFVGPKTANLQSW